MVAFTNERCDFCGQVDCGATDEPHNLEAAKKCESYQKYRNVVMSVGTWKYLVNKYHELRRKYEELEENSLLQSEIKTHRL